MKLQQGRSWKNSAKGQCVQCAFLHTIYFRAVVVSTVFNCLILKSAVFNSFIAYNIATRILQSVNQNTFHEKNNKQIISARSNQTKRFRINAFILYILKISTDSRHKFELSPEKFLLLRNYTSFHTFLNFFKLFIHGKM